MDMLNGLKNVACLSRLSDQSEGCLHVAAHSSLSWHGVQKEVGHGKDFLLVIYLVAEPYIGNSVQFIKAQLIKQCSKTVSNVVKKI